MWLPKSYWRSFPRVIFGLAAIVLMGQSCSFSIGSNPVLDGGVWRSDDKGANWEQKVFVRKDGDKNVRIADVSVLGFAFDPRDSQRIFLGTRENGVWYTEDAGEHWKATSLRSGSYQCLTFDSRNRNIVYTAAGTTVLKSTDGGETWQAVYNESQPNHTVTCVVADPLPSPDIWATTSGGKILLSQDFGHSWTLVQTLPAFAPRRLYIPPDGSGQLIVFTQSKGIYSVTERGNAQADLTEPLRSMPGATDIRAVTIVSGHPDRWYLGTLFGLLVSIDQGASWQVIPTLVNPTSVAIANVAARPNDPRELFITVGQKMHHTVDRGQSWKVTNLPTARIPTWLVLDPSDPQRLFFSTLTPPKK